MKPKLFDRVLLVLLLIIVIAFSLALLGIAMRLLPDFMVQSAVDFAYDGILPATILGATGLLLLIVSLRLLFANGKSKPKEVKPTAALIRTTEFGTTSITLSALDSMAQKHCRANNRIKDCSTNITVGVGGGISIGLKLMLMPDTNVPELTEALQKTLKEYIEAYAGITVNEVWIVVVSTAMPNTRVS